MTRRRKEVIFSTIKNTFDELRLSRYATPLSEPTPSSAPITTHIPTQLNTTVSHKHRYNLRPRKNVSYVEYVENNASDNEDNYEYYSEFFYVDDAKDPDYVPYVHVSASHKSSHPPSSLRNTSDSLRTNISFFITEVNASSLEENGLYAQMGQSNAGVSSRWALRSSMKK